MENSPFINSMINANCEEVRKALVTLVVREKLEQFDGDVFDKVARKLFDDYHCYLPDCYDDPLLLGRVLKELFCNSDIVIESIRNPLSKFSYKEPISRFLFRL
jgi:hypothetical protein